MTPIAVKIRFNSDCFGNERNADYDRFERDSDNNVIFHERWWKSPLLDAAKTLGIEADALDGLKIREVILGKPVLHHRKFKSSGVDVVRVHEAFPTGSEVELRFVLPDKLTPNSFLKILECAGCFSGLSPYGWKFGFGKFKVVDSKVIGASTLLSNEPVFPTKELQLEPSHNSSVR